MLARTLVVPRTEAHPTHQMPVRRKGAQVEADFRDDAFNRALVHPRDRIQGRQRRRERAQLLRDRVTQPLDRLLQIVEMRQQFADQPRVVSPKAPDQGLSQRRQLGAQAAFGQLGQHVRIGDALHQGLRIARPEHAENVGGDRRQLDPGILQHLVQPLRFARAFLG